MSVQKMYFMCIYSPDSFVGFADICADPRRKLPALAQSHEGSRSAHVEHQLRILCAHPLQDAGQCVRVARDRIQFRLRETDELQNATLPCTVSIGATVVSLTMASPVMAEPSSGCRELPSPGM